jgi:DNA-binding PadR family transcriptional regulator
MQSLPGKVPPFNPLALAVMALLHERPMHPYEIACTMRQRHLEESIKLNYGVLYHTVQTLQQAGLITPLETEREGRRPERTVYALTDAGRERFLGSLRDLIRRPAREYRRFEAGLCFLWHLPAEEAVALLRERACALTEELEGYDDLCAALHKRGLGRLALVELEYAQALRRAELAWVERLVDDVVSGALEWRVKPRDALVCEQRGKDDEPIGTADARESLGGLARAVHGLLHDPAGYDDRQHRHSQHRRRP